MKEENVKIQMRKGVMDYCVLAILANNDSYAPAIITELKKAEMIGYALSNLDAHEECRLFNLSLGGVTAGTSS